MGQTHQREAAIFDAAMELPPGQRAAHLDHACGGVCACSTCHCIVREGGDSISEMTDAEDEELSFAPGLQPSSRLSCQSVPDGTRNLVVEIPNWNRNAVREGH